MGSITDLQFHWISALFDKPPIYRCRRAGWLPTREKRMLCWGVIYTRQSASVRRESVDIDEILLA